MDIIPTSLLKRCKVVLSEIIAYLANVSFSEGRFPSPYLIQTIFGHTTYPRPIQGQYLDKSLSSNYRPISNLNFISKILERLFLSRFQSHILTSSNFNKISLPTDPVAPLRLPYSCFSTTSAQLTRASRHCLYYSTLVQRLIPLTTLSCLNAISITGTVYSWLQSYICLAGLSL